MELQFHHFFIKKEYYDYLAFLKFNDYQASERFIKRLYNSCILSWLLFWPKDVTETPQRR